MSPTGDNIILVALLLGLFFVFCNKWFSLDKLVKWLFNKEKKVKVTLRGPIVDQLKELGYECISGKSKVPLWIKWGETEYSSRIYTDYIAKRDGALYVVFVARERKKIKLSGPALRDFFMMHYLLYRPAGILYVGPGNTVKEIRLKLANNYFSKNFHKHKQAKWLMIGLAIGFLLGRML